MILLLTKVERRSFSRFNFSGNFRGLSFSGRSWELGRGALTGRCLWVKSLWLGLGHAQKVYGPLASIIIDAIGDLGEIVSL